MQPMGRPHMQLLMGSLPMDILLELHPHKGTVSLSSICYCCLWYNHCYRYYQPGLLCSLFCIWHLACSDMDNRVAAMVNKASMIISHPLVTLHPPTDAIARFQGNIGNKAAAMGYKVHYTWPPQEHPLLFTSRSLEDVPGQKRTGEWVTWLTWAEEKGDLIVSKRAEVGREEDELNGC